MMIFADHKMKFIRADDRLDNLWVAASSGFVPSALTGSLPVAW